MAVALSACLSKVDVLVVKITESVSTYREKQILNFTRLQFLYNDTNSLDAIGTLKGRKPILRPEPAIMVEGMMMVLSRMQIHY
jgi:hypothetical protein